MSYWGFMSVDLQDDLEAVSSFTSSANYPNPVNALEAEWGSTRKKISLITDNQYVAGLKSNLIDLELLAA